MKRLVLLLVVIAALCGHGGCEVAGLPKELNGFTPIDDIALEELPDGGIAYPGPDEKIGVWIHAESDSTTLVVEVAELVGDPEAGGWTALDRVINPDREGNVVICARGRTCKAQVISYAAGSVVIDYFKKKVTP
jgi:hypothetical protein